MTNQTAHAVAQWNTRYPIGTPVTAYPGLHPEDDPAADRLITRTRSEAQALGGHTAVVWVDGHDACIALSHVDPVQPADTYTPPAKYQRSDGATCCPHATPVAPGSCEACWDLVKWNAVDARLIPSPPAAVSAAVAPPTQAAPSLRAGLRDEIVKALGRITTVPPVAHRREQADHVLAVLYREWPWLRAEAEDAEPTDRAAVLREVADELTRKANKLTERVHDLAYFVAKDRLREAEILDREATALRRMADETATVSPTARVHPGNRADETATQTPARPAADPDCEHCDGSGLDPDAYFVNEERSVWTHAPCSACLPDDEDDPVPTIERVKHSGPDTKFCVLCLSGEHERVDEPAEGARQDGAET